MMRPRQLRRGLLAFALALFTVSSASAFSGPSYLSLPSLDLVTILPPPPLSDSKAQADDIATVMAVQAQSSPERRAQAIADAEITPERFAGALLGPDFTRDKAPKTFALLRRITEEAGRITEKAKDDWGRPRPFVVDARVDVLIRKPKNPSYPSGHTIFGYEMAVVLGAMVPEKRTALFERASDYGQSRIIAGVHYLTDVNAGRIGGTAIAAMLLNAESFKADLAEATGELRAALGLPAMAPSRT
jgi:acid phosphatase (class A)